MDITREDVLVSVGRGIGDKENVAIAEELARATGAALSVLLAPDRRRQVAR